MENWLIYGLVGIIGAFIISLFFEEARDMYQETIEYILTFEWFSDFWDFITSVFEDIGEISFTGLAFGLIGFATVFLARDYMLAPFLEFMSPAEKILWGGATYIGTFIAGYLLGKGFENT